MGCLKLTYYNPTLRVLEKNIFLEKAPLEKKGLRVKKRRSSSTYGFNGMEKDDEVSGSGNSYTTEFRQYDSRLGRWLSLDPKMMKYPSESPYVAFHNNPIYWADPLGDDPPELSELISKGRSESATFIRIMDAADVTLDNYEKVIKYGVMTATKPGSGKISLNSKHSTDKLIIGLAHEFSNRSNLSTLNKLSYDVRVGRISAKEYAKGLLEVEKKAVINQMVVAEEMGITNPYFQDLSERFNKGDITKEEVISEVNDIFDKDKIASGNDGKSIREKYEETGKKLRKYIVDLEESYIKIGESNGLNEEEAKAYGKKNSKKVAKNQTIGAEKIK